MSATATQRRPIRAKITDVAELAGVSTKTVSRVLNNEPNVRVATRDKVKTAIRQLNYVPDFSARSLAGQKSYLLAMFYDTASEGYLNKFQAGALEQCREHGYHLLVERCDNDDAMSAEWIAETAAQTRVDGVILVPPLSDNKAVRKALREGNVPYVLIAPLDPEADAPSVDMDDEGAACQVTQSLIALGHRRIAHIKGHPAHGVTQLRFRGYRRALEEAGIAFDPDLVVEGAFSAESGMEAARKLFALKEAPSAIFAANDDMAAGAIQIAGEMKRRVPDDISVIGFDDALLAALVTPPLTTVRQPVHEMAAGAVDLVIAVAKRRAEMDAEELRQEYKYDVVDRKSIARPGSGR